MWLSDLLRQHAGRPKPDVEVGPEDAALLLFSGGTTGEPKGAVGTHYALLMSGMQLRAWFSTVAVEWDDVVMLTIPLFHVYGNAGIVTVGLLGHEPLVPYPILATSMIWSLLFGGFIQPFSLVFQHFSLRYSTILMSRLVK